MPNDVLAVDNPSVTAGSAVDPAVGNDVSGGSPLSEINYDPMTATRADRVAAITQRLLGADQPAAEPATEPPATPVEPAPAPEPDPVPAPAIEPRADVPDKFLLPDGSINPAFVKSYQNMESMYGRQAQQVNELTQAVINLQNQLLMREMQPQTVTPEPPAPTPEQLAEANEKWLEGFYENPQKALQDVIAKAIKEQVMPITEPMQRDWEFQQSVQSFSKQLDELKGEFPDIDQYRPAMQEILGDSSLNFEAILESPGAMRTVYLMAKGQSALKAPEPAPTSTPEPAKTTDELLKDPAFLSQITANPEVQRMILAGIQNQMKGEPKPPVVGAQAGGTAPAMEPVNIQSTKDANKASRAYFTKVFGGAS